MKYIFLSLLLLSCSKEQNVKKTPAEKKTEVKPVAKNISSPKEFDILKLLLDEESESEETGKTDYKNYSVSFQNDGDSYNVSFRKIAAEDFNKDGIEDYIVERNSEGMLGGNANTNSQILYVIMGENSKIRQKHEILTYAPFSYNILDEITYKNGILKAVATQNFRTYSKPENELETTDLSFIYKDGNVYEESYLTGCELAKWKNKKIFNNSSEYERTIDMHNYTEVINEKYKGSDFELTAELSGCDNLDIVFEGDYKTTDFGQKSIDEKRKRFLDFLAKNISLHKEMSIIQTYYLTHTPSDDYIILGDLSFNIFTNKEKGKLNFRLVLTKEQNPDQSENWEITKRIK